MKKLIYLIPVLCMIFSCDLADEKIKHYDDADRILPVKVKTGRINEESDQMMVLPENANFIPGAALRIEPDFEEGWEPEPGRYKYNWFVIYLTGMGSASERVDLVTESDSYVFDGFLPTGLPQGDSEIYFEIVDPVRNVHGIWQRTIIMEPTPIGSRGVYILKDMGGSTDIDFFPLKGFKDVVDNDGKVGGYGTWELPSSAKLIDTMYKDVISNGFGKGSPLPGTPKGFALKEKRFYWQDPNPGPGDEEGVIDTYGAWFIATDNDVVTATPSMGQLLNHFDQQFYGFTRPSVIAPSALNLRGQVKGEGGLMEECLVVWLVNDGQIYPYNTEFVKDVVFKFGAMPFDDGKAMKATHHMFSNNGAIYWDEDRGHLCHIDLSARHTLWAAGSYNTIEGRSILGLNEANMMAILPGGGEDLVIFNNSKELNAHMILKDKTKVDTYYLVKWVSSGTATGDVWIRNIPAGADIVANPLPVMASSFIGECIYYIKNNQIWLYTDQERPLNQVSDLSAYQSYTGVTIPADETVVDMKTLMFKYDPKDRPIGYPDLNDDPRSKILNSYFAVSVLTSTPSGGYKYYVFLNYGDADELLPTSQFVLEGQGKPVDSYARLTYIML